ncbi:MAG: alpha/beta hydrolase, partial [Burkholderiales bacterium]|nr:alpha/beta hydrolase [Burkholderiales bacterium]
ERDAWVQALSSAVNASIEPQVLVAHSLGCALTVWWAAMGMPGVDDKRRVKAAMLVAPPDVNRPEFPAPSFSPMPTGSLPFPSLVVASDNDPWCELSVSEGWAKSWGAKFHQIGAKGHINGESGLGAWEQGQDWLATLSHCF